MLSKMVEHVLIFLLGSFCTTEKNWGGKCLRITLAIENQITWEEIGAPFMNTLCLQTLREGVNYNN